MFTLNNAFAGIVGSKRRVLKLLPVVCLSMLLCAAPPQTFAYGGGGGGDTGGGKSKRTQKTKKAPAMTEKVYKKLTEAQELIEANKYNEGLAILRELEHKKKLSPYEKAQIYNYFAYTYFTMEKYKEAIRSYEKVLQQPDLPEALQANSLYTLAQLFFIQENYKRAVETIKKWFAITPKPTENAYMLLGQGYYQLEKYKESLVPLKTAYKLVKSRGVKPRESLLLLLRVDYFNLGDYKNMIKVLKELVELYPKTEYWLTMAGAYSEMKQLKKQMSIFEMLYERGELTRGNQQLNLANLYLLHDVPYKAAKVLDKGMKKGIIKKEIRNLRLLSQSWLQAQESKKSIPPLKLAAKLSKDGDLDVRLAQAYINLDNYTDAVAALKSGLKKGRLKRKDQAYVMLGMAQLELKHYNSSIGAFNNAKEYKRSKKTALQWIKFVQSEKNRDQQLAASLSRRRR
ncbi:MAG: CDC27 family protein [Gammaproteobacteria bacterium]